VNWERSANGEFFRFTFSFVLVLNLLADRPLRLVPALQVQIQTRLVHRTLLFPPRRTPGAQVQVAAGPGAHDLDHHLENATQMRKAQTISSSLVHVVGRHQDVLAPPVLIVDL